MRRPLFLLIAALAACMDSQGPATISTQNGLGPATSSGGGGGGGSAASARTVTVGDNFFAPTTLTIPTGDTVTWRWTGNNQHSVTFPDGISSGPRTSGTFQRFFGAPGTYTYSSTVAADSGMSGEIIVQ